MSSHDLAASSQSGKSASVRHESSDTPRRSAILTAALWLIPPLLCLLVYWRGLFAWFQADDFAWLSLRLQIHDWRDLIHELFAPMAQGTSRVLSERAFFIVFSSIFGADALPFRIWVMLTQCANLLLLTAVARRMTGSRAAGFWAAILWLVNNGLALAMVWTSVYNEILCAFFMLAAFWFLLRYIETGRRRDLYCEWAMFLSGFGALEINVVYPALAALYTFTCARKYFRSTLALFVPSVIFTAVHAAVAPPPAGVYALHFDAALPVTFLRYTIWTLTSSQIPAGWDGRLRVAAAALVILALIAFAIRRARARDWLPVFCLSWFVIVIAPLVPLRDHVSDYYVALPAIGPAILAGYALVHAWRRPVAWKAVMAVVTAAYVVSMTRVDRRSVRYRLDASKAVERLVLGVERAHELYPRKTILLDGVDSTLFWTAVWHHPFAALGISSVYLTPGSESRIEARPSEGRVTDYVMPPGPLFQGLREDQIVVYRAGGARLKNITTPYTLARIAQINRDLPHRVDVGNPAMAYLLGPQWYDPEGDHRWMPKRATLRMAGPQSPGEKLLVAGRCSEAELAQGAVKVRVSVDGMSLPEARLGQHDADFHLMFNLPNQLVGRKQVEITVETSRTFHVPGDVRELGLSFGIFEIR
ncbi:MAG TPA: hypothetical protein VJN43_09075 [Bryobacteraceae bacterium]|nr:hypothetical protein [Bryobacteraceae bacterium]